MFPLLVWLAALRWKRLWPLAVVLAIVCAHRMEPLTLARYALVQCIAALAVVRQRPVVLLALLIERAEARLWLGQDALFAFPALLAVGLVGLTATRRNFWLFLAGLWLVQGWVDVRGLLAWMRPLPEPVPDALAIPVLPWALALAALTLRPRVLVLTAFLCVPLAAFLPIRQSLWVPRALPRLETRVTTLPGWLLVSNNPEMVYEPGLLFEGDTPPGHGRLLISHINRALTASELVLEADQDVRVIRFAQARDNLWLDAGTLLQERFRPTEQRGRRWTVPNLRLNGLLMLEVETDRPVHWRVWMGQPAPALARTGGQSAGVFANPDQVLTADVTRPCQIPLEGPWLLPGDYGAMRTFRLTVSQPTEVLWKARGGVLDGAPAGCARHLATWQPGQHELTLSLPANAFAPSALLLVPTSFSPLD